jgi:diguanylate cyclase (GGDEF)-like protein
VVNDSCGHLCGDELLRQVAQLLRRKIRSKDILSLIGGDEFGLILVSCSQDVGSPSTIDNQQVSVIKKVARAKPSILSGKVIKERNGCMHFEIL